MTARIVVVALRAAALSPQHSLESTALFSYERQGMLIDVRPNVSKHPCL
jgi:hypothetical protein